MTRASLIRFLPVGLAILLVAGYVGVTTLGTGSGFAAAPAPAPYKPVADLDIIMDQVDEFFEAAKESLEANKFRTLRKQSAFLAELMNITGYFDHSEYSKEAGWVGISVKTRDLLLEAQKVAKKKDGDAFKALMGKIDASCESCHEKYRDSDDA